MLNPPKRIVQQSRPHGPCSLVRRLHICQSAQFDGQLHHKLCDNPSILHGKHFTLMSSCCSICSPRLKLIAEFLRSRFVILKHNRLDILYLHSLTNWDSSWSSDTSSTMLTFGIKSGICNSECAINLSTSTSKTSSSLSNSSRDYIPPSRK